MKVIPLVVLNGLWLLYTGFTGIWVSIIVTAIVLSGATYNKRR